MILFVIPVILIGFVSLFLKNVIVLAISCLFLLMFSIVNNNLTTFLRNLEKLSSFCIGIFLSYILIAFLKNSENLFFIYSMNAVSIILKIMIILLLNLIVRKYFKFLSKIAFIRKINIMFGLFGDLEKKLFLILDRYNGKFNVLMNTDKIVVEFIVTVLCSTVENSSGD